MLIIFENCYFIGQCLGVFGGGFTALTTSLGSGFVIVFVSLVWCFKWVRERELPKSWLSRLVLSVCQYMHDTRTCTTLQSSSVFENVSSWNLVRSSLWFRGRSGWNGRFEPLSWRLWPVLCSRQVSLTVCGLCSVVVQNYTEGLYMLDSVYIWNASRFKFTHLWPTEL